jgi:Arabinose-binding domain of AraC transcription regulator, N-term
VSEGQQRVGAFAEVPHLLRELGVDPAEVAAGVGLDLNVLQNAENTIPFTVAGKLLQASAMRTGCAHSGLLLGQRCDTRSLGLVGSLMRNARTWGQAVQDLVDKQPRYVRGGAPYLVVHDGVAWAGYAIHQRGTEGIDHFCDGAITVGFNMMRELCGALPDEVRFGPQASSRCPTVSPFLSGPRQVRCRTDGPCLPRRSSRTSGA